MPAAGYEQGAAVWRQPPVIAKAGYFMPALSSQYSQVTSAVSEVKGVPSFFL